MREFRVTVKDEVQNNSLLCRVVPSVIDIGGIAGEHNATRITFVLPESWNVDEGSFFVECESNNGEAALSVELSVATENGAKVIYFDIPYGMTAAGTSELTLKQETFDEDGKTLIKCVRSAKLRVRFPDSTTVDGENRKLAEDLLGGMAAEVNNLVTRFNNGEFNGQDGADGAQGEKGDPGADATINGVPNLLLQQGEGIVFEQEEDVLKISANGIPKVFELPERGVKGDLCFYSVPGILAQRDSNGSFSVSFFEFQQLSAIGQDASFELYLRENGIDVAFIYLTAYKDKTCSYQYINYVTSEEYVIAFNNGVFDKDSSSILENGEYINAELSEFPESFTLPEFDSIELYSEGDLPERFQNECHLMEYDNGWRKVSSLLNIRRNNIQSITAFPEIANEGDVVLLHRCNEISVDDSNSGIILDPAAVASLKLPEGITNRRWEFVNTTPNGADFELILEQVRIDEDVPYVLTSIYLFSETYADRWYWKDGEPYTDIPETSTKPVPGYIPLGVITDFTATKSPMRGDEVWDVEDTDSTVIFRTAPREYIYTSGGWKLTERTDAAEGSIIAEVKPVVRDGKNFLELRLTDSRGFKMGQRKKYIYIPVESVKETGGINQQSVELIFPTAGTGGIKSVSALPTVANEGDVVYYCPPPNRLTAADSGHKVYLNNKWVNECPVLESGNLNRYTLDFAGKSAGSLKFDKDESKASALLNDMKGWKSFRNEFAPVGGVYIFSSAESYGVVADSTGRTYAPSQIETATLPDFDTFEIAKEEAPGYVYFYVLPRFYRYTKGEWVELPYSEPELPDEVDCTLTDTTLTYGILPNILYRFGEVDRLNLDLLLPDDNKVDEYQFSFISGETATVLTLPDNVIWAGGKALEAVPNAQYTVTVLNGVASFETTAKDKIWTAIEEIRGGIDEIETLIDNSGVLDE